MIQVQVFSVETKEVLYTSKPEYFTSDSSPMGSVTIW